MDKVLILPDSRERSLGWRYLLFQVVFLSRLLSLVLYVLRINTSDVFLNLLYFSANFAVAIFCFRRFWRETFSGVWKSLPRIIVFAFAGFGAFRVVSIAMEILIPFIDPNFVNVNDLSIQALFQEGFWPMAVGTVVLVPVAEEVFHRGCVFGGLLGRNPVAAYVVSAVVFSLIHINGYIGIIPPQALLLCFLQYLPAGLCLAAAYQLSGSILTPILIHSAVNIIEILTMR